MGIKTVPQPPYSPDLAPCDFWLFPKLRGCCYETIEEMKEALMKVIERLTQEDFHGAFQNLLERYNKCIAAGGDYFKGDLSFMCILSLKVPIRKRLETYLMNLVYIYIYIYIYMCTRIHIYYLSVIFGKCPETMCWKLFIQRIYKKFLIYIYIWIYGY